jgi:hypothetical protein
MIVNRVPTLESFLNYAKSVYPETKKNLAMVIALQDLYRCNHGGKIIMESSKPFTKIFDRLYRAWDNQ